MLIAARPLMAHRSRNRDIRGIRHSGKLSPAGCVMPIVCGWEALEEAIHAPQSLKTRNHLLHLE